MSAEPRILALSGTPHPQAEVQAIDPASGVLSFRWLNEEGVAVDSGGSVARFTPVDPLPNEDPAAPVEYPDISDEILTAAIVAALVDAPQSAAEIYVQQQALGYEDTITGLKLKTTEYAQGKFTSQVALVRLALSAGAIDNDTPQTFWDFNDAQQTLSTADFLALMLRYGLHCSAMFGQYAP